MKEGSLVQASARVGFSAGVTRFALGLCAFLSGLITSTVGAPSTAVASEVAQRIAMPADPRLDPVREALERLVDRAVKDGLPAEMIVSKAREGLAKGVPPEAIRSAAERLAESLGAAAQMLRVHRPASPSPSLIRLVAEARMAGVRPDEIAPLVTSPESDAMVARAIEVVTDLAMRGYPSRRSVLVVKEVADRDALALGRVVAGLESIRLEQTVSRADALETLGRNLQSSGASLDWAVARALEAGDRAGGGSASSPGRSADAPGHQGTSGAAKSKKPKK